MILIVKDPTRKEAKCSDVITALKPTTGTSAARRVPRITYETKYP